MLLLWSYIGKGRLFLNKKAITVSILLGVAALLIGWDIYVYFAGDRVDLITSVVWNTSREHPVVPFLVGVVMGHLFWGRGDTNA